MTFKVNTYLELVKMLYTNLIASNDTLSCFVMYRHVVLNSNVLVAKLDMDVSLTKLVTRSFPTYSKDKANIIIFPYSTPKNVNGTLLITY